MEITRSTNQQVSYSLENGSKRIIRGVASVFYDGTPGTEYQIGPNVFERIASTAFDKVLASNDRVWMADNHNLDKRVARTPTTLKVWKSTKGLEYEGQLNNSSAANDVWENVTSGNYTGSSFRAGIDLQDKTTHTWSRDGDKRILTHTSFTNLVEVSPVYDPAFPATTTEAIKRSLDQWEADEETQKRLERAKIINSDNR